jgi:tryptophanyl-tRNA synthetase
MSKSYGNTIRLREPIDDVAKKINTMPTDPARIRLTDPGNPEKCPVWQLHEIYSDKDTQTWVQHGCRSAGIGCLTCKKPVIDAVVNELEPMQARARVYQQDTGAVRAILIQGAEKARANASETLRDVRQAMGLGYYR